MPGGTVRRRGCGPAGGWGSSCDGQEEWRRPPQGLGGWYQSIADLKNEVGGADRDIQKYALILQAPGSSLQIYLLIITHFPAIFFPFIYNVCIFFICVLVRIEEVWEGVEIDNLALRFPSMSV